VLCGSPVFLILLWLSYLPSVLAMPTTPFPGIPFKIFSTFIDNNFGPDISLATVLLIFLSLIENPELLNLHARQKHPRPNEQPKSLSAWIRSLSRQLYFAVPPFSRSTLDSSPTQTTSQPEKILAFAKTLDQLITLLRLSPYEDNIFKDELQVVSQNPIQPVHLICPINMECTTLACQSHFLKLNTRSRDIPLVTLLQGSAVITNAAVLTAECTSCKALYTADTKRYYQTPDAKVRTDLYLNSARYLQVGSNTWAARSFSNAVINGMQSFHASANSYMQYWNNSFGSMHGLELDRRHIWQAFVQESTRTLALSADIDFETKGRVDIDTITEEAFNILGNDGQLNIAHNHSCSECTKPFKQSVQDSIGDPSVAPVKMVVLDGIVMGPTVCIYIYYCLTTNNFLSSIAPFQTVLRTFRMLEVVHYVAITRLFWVQNAV